MTTRIVSNVSQAGLPEIIYKPKVSRKCGIALLQIYYNLFTLGLDMLTGKNAGDIINLNQRGVVCPY